MERVDEVMRPDRGGHKLGEQSRRTINFYFLLLTPFSFKEKKKKQQKRKAKSESHCKLKRFIILYSKNF